MLQSAKAAGRLALLQYTANWCPPCKAITPAVNRLSRMEKDVVFMRVDIDRVPMVAQVMSVRQLPTFTLFWEGQRVADYPGTNISEVLRLIRKHKPAPPPRGFLGRLVGGVVRVTVIAAAGLGVFVAVKSRKAEYTLPAVAGMGPWSLGPWAPGSSTAAAEGAGATAVAQAGGVTAAADGADGAEAGNDAEAEAAARATVAAMQAAAAPVAVTTAPAAGAAAAEGDDDYGLYEDSDDDYEDGED